ncbi:MAG TPA: hypothetical protein VG777_03975 [Thermoanaerobaculia bacterium]|nr:hypothetical protein [Thermoanaerobaculia bacterium]
MKRLVRFLAAALLAFPVSADVLLTMKTGERYELAQAPKHRNGMVSFTTKDGRFLTVRQSEVASEQTVVLPAPKQKLDRTDTRQLGAIAREQRAERGIDADVEGKPQKSARRSEKPAEPEKKPKAAHRAKKRSAPPPPPPAADVPRQR